MYMCDICGKSFAQLRNLTRHLNTHTGGQTYSCSICDKTFKRPDVRKRHEASHNSPLNCDICGQFFNRPDSLRRHRALHDRPIVKPATKRPASPQPNSPAKRPRTVSPSIPVEEPEMDRDTILPEDPETRTLYLRHWNSIRTTENTGNVVQDRFNFQMNDIAASNFPEMVRLIFNQQTTAFKINLSFGFMLRHNETGELRFYHPSQNNARFLEVPHLINNEEDLERFLDELIRQDLLEYIRQQREDTKWIVHLITNVTFYINKLRDHPIGAHVQLPDFYLRNKGLVCLTGGSNGPYNDDLCLFRCLAVHKGATIVNLETPARTYFQQYLQHRSMRAREFVGVYLHELEIIESLFQLTIFVYALEEEDNQVRAKLVRRSPYKFEDCMKLNLFENHFSYISDMDQYAHSFSCRKCGKLWKSTWSLHRHEQTCDGNINYNHPGGVYHPVESVFKELEDECIIIPQHQRFYPYRATYDIEAMLADTDKAGSEKLEWTSQHILLSMSICSNVPGFTEPLCFISEGNPDALVSSCLTYLSSISDAAFDQLIGQYYYVTTEVERRIEEDVKKVDQEERETAKKNHHLNKLKKKLHRYLHELPVIGFNSGKYDLNAMKIQFFSRLIDYKILFTVKRNNNFLCVKTEKLKFLDITNYLAPGYSYSQFLKAFGCTEEKGHFPYEWMTSLDKLDSTQLPPHEAFHSTLKNANISAEEYQHCQKVWTDNNMSTMSDFLVWYNNKDVVPMLEAVEKMHNFYRNQNIDMFKEGVSVPGLTLKLMFKDLPTYFTLPTEKYKEVYRLLKSNIVGGPSIVFHRYHEKDVTLIRPMEYPDPKPCKKIVGFDANALYLWCIMQDMPTRHFSVRCAPDFQLDMPLRYKRLAIQWLEWESLQSGQYIRHQGNDTEKLVGMHRIPVDGFCKETNTLYEFQGCWWHGCPCARKTVDDIHPVRNMPMSEIYAKTKSKIQYLQDQGYNVVEIWECQWLTEIKRNPDLKHFVESQKRPCDRYKTMTEKQILKAVMEDRLFGALEVDIEVPDNLKSHFSEMPPIFKNAEISRDHIGEHMKTYAEERNIMNQPRRSLISSMFGEKIWIITPLLKWYIQHGLIVTKIHQVLEYTPSDCFRPMGEHISDARRAGDADLDKKIVAETEKLKGCSMYGTTATNKEKHVDVRFCKTEDVNIFLRDPLFRQCNQLKDDVFEITMSKSTINLDLPLQIACFVYQYAKLRMLAFYYDFVNFYLDRKDFQYCSMDTDSAYMALSSESLETIIKPELLTKYQIEKHQWFPRDDTPANAAYDKRTPGLFKEEYSGDGIVALCSKTYYCFGQEDKYSCKGVNKRTNNINKNTYMDVLLTKKSASGTNRGFRSIDHQIYTYLQERAAFTYFYPKRIVLEDGISTAPLDL